MLTSYHINRMEILKRLRLKSRGSKEIKYDPLSTTPPLISFLNSDGEITSVKPTIATIDLPLELRETAEPELLIELTKVVGIEIDVATGQEEPKTQADYYQATLGEINDVNAWLDLYYARMYSYSLGKIHNPANLSTSSIGFKLDEITKSLKRQPPQAVLGL